MTEAPRLWYLQARKLLEQCGLTELRCVRAVFTLRERCVLLAILALHVDDGMLWGRCSHPAYKQARSRICQLFNIKTCTKMVDGQDVDYLGAPWCKNGSRVKVHMSTYIETLAEATVEGKVEEKLSKEQIAMARNHGSRSAT